MIPLYAFVSIKLISCKLLKEEKGIDGRERVRSQHCCLQALLPKKKK